MAEPRLVALLPRELDGRKVLFFDGVCNLCSGTVDFVLAHERSPELTFASLQSELGQRVLAAIGASPTELDSMVFVDGGRVLTKSSAALALAAGLRWPWRLARLACCLPTPLTDAVYGFVARRRYRWFGRAEACRLPTPELKARFLG